MMKGRTIVSLFVIIIASLHEGNAQQSSNAKILTFKEAVAIGLMNNVNLKQQQNQQYVNQAVYRAAWANTGPRVDGRVQAFRTIGNQFIEQEATVINDARTNNISGSVEANIVLFNGFGRINAIGEANARAEAQQLLVKRTEQDVISDICSQYLQCLLDQEVLKFETQSLETHKRQLYQIQEQVAVGAIAAVDEYNQEFQVRDAELRVVRAQNTFRNDKAILANTLLLDPRIDFELREPDREITDTDFASFELEQLYQVAERNRADLLRAGQLEKAASKNRRVAFAPSLPTLSGFASTSSFYTNASIPLFESQITTNKRMTYGLHLYIPIFSNLRNRADFIRSRVDYMNAQLNAANVDNTVKNDVLRAYQNYNDAVTSYQAGIAQLKAAELNFKFQKERYDLAITDLIQFTQANRDLVQAQTNFAQTKYTLMFQSLLLDYAVGTLSPSDID